MPNEREIATLILLGVVAIWVLVTPRARAGIPAVVRAALAPRLMALWLSYVTYSVLVFFVAWRLGAWEPAMTWATIVVVGTVGFPLLTAAVSNTSGSPGHHLKRRIFGASAIAGLYVNLASFSVPVELVIQVAAALATLLQAVASREPAHAPVAKLMRGVLLLLGILIIWRTTNHLLGGMARAEWVELGAITAIALWFPAALPPLLYPVAYLSATEVAATRTLVLSKNPRRSKIGLWFALLLALRGRLSYAQGFAGDWAWRLARASDRGERRRLLKEYREAAVMQGDGSAARG